VYEHKTANTTDINMTMSMLFMKFLYYGMEQRSSSMSSPLVPVVSHSNPFHILSLFLEDPF
jgi:hypothetical protein